VPAPACRSGSPATEPSGPGAKLDPPDPDPTQPTAHPSAPPWTQGANGGQYFVQLAWLITQPLWGWHGAGAAWGRMGPHGAAWWGRMGLLAWCRMGLAWCRMGPHGVGMGSHGAGMGRMGPHGDGPTGPLVGCWNSSGSN
jgi:hypothetical protein